jgi:hypothetical protein
VKEFMFQYVLPFLVSGGLFSFVQFFISFGFSRKDKSKDIENQLKEIREDNSKQFAELNTKIDYNSAVLARTHILRFNDEILNGINHSKEYFRQQLDDCDTYDKFCDKHPDFKNSYTMIANKYIKDTYDRLTREGKL